MRIIIEPKGEKALDATKDFLLMKDLSFFEKKFFKVLFEVRDELPERIVLLGKKPELGRVDLVSLKKIINDSFSSKGVKEEDFFVRIE